MTGMHVRGVRLRGMRWLCVVGLALALSACAQGTATPGLPSSARQAQATSVPLATPPAPAPAPSLTPAAIATATPLASPQPTPTAGAGTQLALLIGEPPLSLVDLSGGQAQALGAGNLDTYGSLYFEWSPDGSRLAYSAAADLWLLDAATGRSSPLTDDDRWSLLPAWSPDGTRLAFTSRPRLPDETKQGWMQGEWGGALTVVGADGQEWRVLDEQGTIRLPPSWAPDGQRLAYAADGELRLYDLAHDTRQVMPAAGFGLDAAYFAGPAWSPDGRSLAVYFARSAPADPLAVRSGSARPAGQGVAILDLEDRQAQVLSSWHGVVTGEAPILRWQPGGRLLLVDLRAGPGTDLPPGLWLVDPAADQVTPLGKAAYDAAWSPDGARLAAIDLGDRQALHVWDVHAPDHPATRRWPAPLEGLAWRPAHQ